eukprot:TRINITY_DN35270_c0_g1_i1.p1 TRINITY_DN35270_c0_g1~~TRINITY_DN35270_c0_g1_i1.p1  ORF type:complete len:436 (+),score=67.40 TRINITY_DN35270_c0_g1_i1:224-1531(+)
MLKDFGERPVLLGHSATLDAKPKSLDQGDPTTSAGMASLPKKPAPRMITSPTNSGTSPKSTISADWPWSPLSSPQTQFQIPAELPTDSPRVFTPGKRFEITVDSDDSSRSEISSECPRPPMHQGVCDFFANEPASIREWSGSEQSDPVAFGKTLSLPAGGKKPPNFHVSAKISDTFRPNSDVADDKQLGSIVFGKTSRPARKTTKTRFFVENPGSLQSDSEDDRSDSVPFGKALSLPAGRKTKARTRFRVKTPGSLKPDCEVMESDFMAFAKTLSLQPGYKMSAPAHRKHSCSKTPAGSSELRDLSTSRHWSKDSTDIDSLDARTCGAERHARIFVKLPCGKLLAVNAELSQSVTSFKQKLLRSFAAEFGEGNFVLSFRKKRLPSNPSLKQQGIELGNVVHASRAIARAPPGVGAKTFRRHAYFVHTNEVDNPGA